MEEEKIKCRACREPIWLDASVCPHCQTKQNKRFHQTILFSLKELSAITVIFTLIFAVVELNKFADAWFENSAFAERLATSAEMLIDTGDYQSARKLLSDAKEISPASEKVSNLQKNLAMITIRKNAYSSDSSPKEIEISLDYLYHALGQSQQSDADILAHIAFANFLLGRSSSVDINLYLEKALALDRNNLYANAFKAVWYLRVFTLDKNSPVEATIEVIEKIRKHFEIALSHNTEIRFIRKLQLKTLHNYKDGRNFEYRRKRFGDVEYVKAVLEIYKQDRTYFDTWGSNIHYHLEESLKWGLANYFGHRQAIQNTEKSAYLDKVFLSLSTQDTNLILNIFRNNPEFEIHSYLITALLNEKNSHYDEAIRELVIANALSQLNHRYTDILLEFQNYSLQLLKELCTKQDVLNTHSKELCIEFSKNNE